MVEFRVDVEEIEILLDESYKLLTISSVIKELEKINSKNAKLALKLISLKRIEILETEERSADRAILNLVDKDTVVATNDIKLRKKLKVLDIKTIYLRAKKHLAMS